MRAFLARLNITGLLTLLLVFPLYAQNQVYTFDDPAKEKLYDTLIYELRCLVCQNQNLADSNAELAADLRRKTYEMIEMGKSHGEITAYMVERYGDFVTYRPPLKSSTLVLWIAPFIVLVMALAIAWYRIRQTRAGQAPVMNPAEAKRIDRLLDDD